MSDLSAAMRSRVKCYAGTRYPERPVAFEWEGVWLTVADVISQVRTPWGIVFHVIAQGGRSYQLGWYEFKDEWRISVHA